MLRAENRAHAALHAIVVASTASVAVSPQATLPQPTIRRVRSSAEPDCMRAPRMGLLCLRASCQCRFANIILVVTCELAASWARFAIVPNESAMNATAVPTRDRAIHPFHAAVLGGVWPLFLGTLLSDYAYWSSYQIQWSNFASWLLVGAMVLTTLALVAAIVGLVRGSRNVIYLIALVATWIVGFFDALHHARDAWAIMPAALVLSGIATLFALVATWAGLSGLRMGGAR